MRFGNGGVTVVRGVSDDVDVVISADLNKMADEKPPKPKVSGAARHPKLALNVSKLLEPPHGTWQEEARRFFAFATAHPGIPKSMRVVCTDDGSELTLGDAPAEYELHGSEHALLNVFCGNTVLGQDLLDGKIFAVGKLAHLAELTGRSLAWMLGRLTMDPAQASAQAVAWLEEHSIAWVKTEGISIDGLVIGKHLSTRKFVSSLPLGNAITEFVLGYDIGGTPFLAWWDDWRREALGDFHQRPDLSTLVAAPDRPGTANVICDIVDLDGNPVPVCPRSKLRNVIERLDGHGLTAKAAFEIEVMLFRESYEQARAEEAARPDPDGSSRDARLPALQLAATTAVPRRRVCNASTVSASRSRVGTTRPHPVSSSSTSTRPTRSPRAIASCASSRCCAKSPWSKAVRSRSWPSPARSTATGCTCTTRWRATASRCSTPPTVTICPN